MLLNSGKTDFFPYEQGNEFPNEWTKIRIMGKTKYLALILDAN